MPDVTEGGSHAKGWMSPNEHSPVDCFATVLARRVLDIASIPLRFLLTPRHSGREVLTLAAALGALQDALSLRGVAAKVWVQAVVHAGPALGLRFSPLTVTTFDVLAPFGPCFFFCILSLPSFLCHFITQWP